MATVISIAIGATTISKTYNITNARARDTILAFYAAQGLGPADATEQQKIEAAINWWITTMKDVAFAKYEYDRRATTNQEANTLYGFE